EIKDNLESEGEIDLDLDLSIFDQTLTPRINNNNSYRDTNNLNSEMDLKELMNAIKEIKEQLDTQKQQVPNLAPPKYKGREDHRDWEQYLKEYCRIGDALGWTENTLSKTLPNYLESEALAMYDLLTDQEKSSWENIKKAMGEKLSQDHQGNCLARSQLVNRDQKPGESVSEYAAAIESLVKKGFPKDKYTEIQRAELIVDAFYRGLKYNLRKVLIRHKQPKTLAEAITAAQNEELNQKILAEEELKINGKSRQESLENEQNRLCKELEKLKTQLAEKLNEEKINIIKTEQSCSNCPNCNPNPIPLANIRPPNNNYTPYRNLSYNYYNNRRSFYNRRGFANRQLNNNQFNQVRYQNPNNINYNNNYQNDNNNANFGPYRPRRRGRGGYPVTAVLPFIVTIICLIIFSQPIEGFSHNCQKYIFTGLGVRCSKILTNECNKIEIPIKINFTECLSLANPIRYSLKILPEVPKWKISKNIPDKKCQKIYESICISFAKIYSLDGIVINSELLDKSCPIMPNFYLTKYDSIIWDKINPFYKNKIDILNMLEIKNVIKIEKINEWILKTKYMEITENLNCLKHKSRNFFNIHLPDWTENFNKIINNTKVVEEKIRGKIENFTENLKDSTKVIIDKTQNISSSIKTNIEENTINKFKKFTNDFKIFLDDIWWWIKFILFGIIIPAAILYFLILTYSYYRKIKLFFSDITWPWKVFKINTIELQEKQTNKIEWKNKTKTKNNNKILNGDKEIKINYLNYSYNIFEEKENLPIIDIPVGAKVYPAIVDTGSNISFGPINIFEEAGLQIYNIDPIMVNLVGGGIMKLSKITNLKVMPKGLEIINLNFYLYEDPNIPLIIGLDHLLIFEKYGIKAFFNRLGRIDFDFTEYDKIYINATNNKYRENNFIEEKPFDFVEWIEKNSPNFEKMLPEFKPTDDARLPIINIIINQISVDALFDSGAEISLCTASFAKKINAKMVCYKHLQDLHTPIGKQNEIKIIGCCILNVEVGTFIDETFVWLTEEEVLPFNFILGYDIIKLICKQIGCIPLKTGEIFINENNRSYIQNPRWDNFSMYMYYTSQSMLPVIGMKLNGQNIKSLFDSGASISYVRESIMYNYNLEKINNSELPKARAANQSTFRFIAKCRAYIQIGNIYFSYIFLVTEDNNCPYPWLVGADFMKKLNELGNSIILEFHRNKIIIGESEIPLIAFINTQRNVENNINDHYKNKYIPVIAPKEIILEPRTDNLVIGETEYDCPNLYITNPPTQFPSEFFLVGRTIGNLGAQKMAKLRLMNPTQLIIRIQKGENF
ncbi:Reverse transcriptase domain-containing protein, partial [Meloidogyne graminicola]